MTFSPLRQIRQLIMKTLPKARGSQQKVVTVVMQGLRATLEDERFEVLIPRLNAIDVDLRGFAYEGAGCGLTIFDTFFPWGKRLQAFVRGPGDPYIIPVYIGVGLALGRLNSRRPEQFLTRLDYPAFRWMVMDGYGFYKGFFTPKRYLTAQYVPANLSPYARRVFDQGLGRSIWFAMEQNSDQVVSTIAAFPEARRADLWNGAGFACAYAGNAMERRDLETLLTLAGPYQPQLALAAALAAKRRYGFGHITPHTELACQVFCGLSGAKAAQIANDTLENLPDNGPEPAHALWRQRIAARLAMLPATAVNRDHSYSPLKEQ